MNKILLVTNSQYGYHSDPYYLSLYLEKRYEVIFLHKSRGFKEITAHQCKLINIPGSENQIISRFISIYYAIKTISKNDPDVTLVFKFPFCFILPVIFRRKNLIYDIRSGGVSDIYWKRKKNDLIVQFNSLFFKNITVISDSLAQRLKIRNSKYEVLPVGAEIISNKKKQFKSMRLLYVGTFDNRKIDETLIGLASYLDKNQNIPEISYTIIGFGKPATVDKIKKTILDYNLADIVTLVGKKYHEELREYFDYANIGISYVPINEYYDVQPPTKTYEYLLSNMVVIATNTFENSKVIGPKNGVLIEDNPAAFCSGLEFISKKLHTYKASVIQDQVNDFTWENIVNNKLIPLFQKKR